MFSLVRPWLRRNEPWIDEACLWAQGVYLVAQHMAKQVSQYCTSTWTRRGAESQTEEMEVEFSLPLDNKPLVLPGAMVVPYATSSTPGQNVESGSSTHSPTPPTSQSSEFVPQDTPALPAPQLQTLKMITPTTHVSRRTPRSAGQKKVSPMKQDTQNMPLPTPVSSGSPTGKRKRASEEESLVLAHMEARIQAQGQPATKVRRRAPTSARRAPGRRIASQTSLLPRPKREHREMLHSSEPSRSGVQTRAQRARSAARST